MSVRSESTNRFQDLESTGSVPIDTIYTPHITIRPTDGVHGETNAVFDPVTVSTYQATPENSNGSCTHADYKCLGDAFFGTGAEQNGVYQDYLDILENGKSLVLGQGRFDDATRKYLPGTIRESWARECLRKDVAGKSLPQ